MQSCENEARIREYAAMSDLELQSKKGGLSTKEAEEMRLKYGSANFRELRQDTLAMRLRRAFINPFSAVLTVLALISLFADVIFAREAERSYTTVIIISAMLLISGCIRLMQELKSKKITDRLLSLTVSPVSVKRDGKWTKLDISQLAAGDVVRLEAGERVPADMRLIKVRDCFMSESAVTGESEPVEKTAEAVAASSGHVSSFKNIAFCGSVLVSGSFEGIVFALGSDTLYGEIPLSSYGRRQGYDRGANSIAAVLIRFMILLVPLVFVAGGLTKGNWVSAFLFAISVAVGLTPELLPMVITACLAKGSFNMSQKQTVVKNVNAMQGFGSMDVLCIDKTGTLTEDSLLLEYYMDILGNEDIRVLDTAFLNSFYHSGISHHLDAAILKVRQMPGHGEHFGELTDKYEKADELPFDYSRKIASVLLKSENESVLISKGSADGILRHCRYACYKGELIPIGSESYASVHGVVDEMLEDGMKVLAVAAKPMNKTELTSDDEKDMILIGYLGFFDSPKKTAASAIDKLNRLQVDTKVLTGDNLDTSVSVCRRLGMDVSRVITGEELDKLSDNDIQVRIEDTVLFAELSPSQKAHIVEVLQSNGHTVGFLADGMNDLPAVIKSDVGISVDTAVPSVKECADVILLKKDLNVLESGITEGRRAFANMTKYIKITASSNLGNIFAIVFASVFLPFFPMTSVQILLLNLLYDILCLVLPWDNVDFDMIQKPLEWSGKTLSHFMMVFGPISSVFDIITFIFLYAFLCPGVCGGMYGTLSPASQAQFISVFQTGWFLESMWTQVLILHLLRTSRLPFLESRPSAPVLGVTLAGVAAFTLLAITPAGSLMGMTCLPPVYFIFLISDVLLYLAAVTLAKRAYIKRRHRLI